MSTWNCLGITPVSWCMFVIAGVKVLDSHLVSAQILEERVNSPLQCIFHAYFNIVFLSRHKQLLQMIIVKDHCYFLCQFGTFSFLLVHIWHSAINPRHCNQTKWLPRKYTWPLGGYFCLYKSGKYIFSKSSTARAGACACASASEAPSSSSAWYATSSRASNLVKIATTGTAKNINI